MVLAEASVSSLHREVGPKNEEANDEVLEDALDVIDERRDQILLLMQSYQQKRWLGKTQK